MYLLGTYLLTVLMYKYCSSSSTVVPRVIAFGQSTKVLLMILKITNNPVCMLMTDNLQLLFINVLTRSIFEY